MYQLFFSFAFVLYFFSRLGPCHAMRGQYSLTQSIKGEETTSTGFLSSAISGGFAGALGGPTSNLTDFSLVRSNLRAGEFLNNNITKASLGLGLFGAGVSNGNYESFFSGGR